METRAGYIAVGSTVFLIFVAALGFVLWMARYDGDTAVDRYRILFAGSVTGLKTGSSVSYRGINVGEVVSLRIDPDNPERVQATIEILSTTPIKTTTEASLELQGITGGALVMLSGGRATDPELEAADGEDYPTIEARPSQLERLFEGAPALVERIDLLVTRVIALLNPENQKAIGDTLANVQVLTGHLAQGGPEVQQAIASANRAMARVEGLIANAEGDVLETLAATAATMRAAQGAVESAETTFASLNEATGKIGRAAGTMNAMLDENRRPLRDFTHVTLYDINAFVADLRELAVTMRRVAAELGRDPAGFLFGNQQKGYEAR